jgi:lysophospholipase L1-like esterase
MVSRPLYIEAGNVTDRIIISDESLTTRNNNDMSAAKKNYTASAENVKYIGRYLFENDTAWLVQSGSAVEFSINARSAEVILFGDERCERVRSQRARFALIVDGNIVCDDVVGSRPSAVQLFKGDCMRDAKIKIIHLSEAANGAVGISGIRAESDVDDPIRPLQRKPLSIEFIGDSITCGYGVEGASEREKFRTTTENFMRSYAYLVAEKLGADYSAVCYSGHGLISGYTSNGKKAGESLISPYYENIGSYGEYAIPWNFNAYPNDVIVLNLGTNDASYIDRDFAVRSREFVPVYTQFLYTVRSHNPSSYIICTLGIMGCAKEYLLIKEAISDYKSSTGDNKIFSFLCPSQKESDGYGCDWHPSEATQIKSAEFISGKLSAILGIS